MAITNATRAGTTPAAPAAPPEPKAGSGGGAIQMISLAIGFVMATLDVTVVNVAGADIKSHLGMTLSSVTWVIDGYVLTFAALLLLAGSLANRFGAKQVYLAGLVVFIVASAAAGAAPNGTALVAARLVQGVGAALFMPSSLSLLVGSYPDEGRRAKMIALWSAIVSLAAGLGPVVGGLLVDTLGWRSIFLINLPLGVAGLALTARTVTAPPARPGRIAPAGHALGIVALAGLSFVLIEGQSYGWTSPAILGAAAVAVLAAALFVVRERRGAEPIMPTRLFADGRFSAANAIGFLLSFGLYGCIFMLGLFFQEERGATPLQAGGQLVPMMLVFVVGNLLFAKISAKTGVRKPMIIGLTVAGLTSAALVPISSGTPYWAIALVIGLGNLGVGVTVPAMTAALMQAAGRENANVASATLNANRQVGSLVGVAAISAMLGASADWYQNAGTTFTAVAVAYLAAALLAWRFIKAPAQS